MPKYNIEVQLSESNGNAYAIIGKVAKALRKADAGEDEVIAFIKEAKAGDYDHLLQTCMKWVDVA